MECIYSLFVFYINMVTTILSYSNQCDKRVKGVLHPNFCHNLLTLELLQTCMSLFLLLNTKEYILKNDWNQMVSWHHWFW